MLRKPTTKYYIYISELNETEADAEPFLSSFTEPTLIAQEFAESLYTELDGWDWMNPGIPYEVVIMYPDGSQIPVEISFDLEPMFYACKKGVAKTF